MGKTLNLTFDGNVAIIELTNGKNELTQEFLDDFDEALDRILNNPSADVLVTFGTGKHFSNGIDVPGLVASGFQNSLEFFRKLSAVCVRLTTFPMPTVAAMNGHAMAGGAVLALCFDYRVMNSDKGWICLTEILNAMSIPKTLIEIIKSKIPIGNAQRDMIVMGKRLTAQEALQAGVVDQTAPEKDVLHQALNLARELVKNGSYGREPMANMKKDVYSNAVDTIGDNKYNFMTRNAVKSTKSKI